VEQYRALAVCALLDREWSAAPRKMAEQSHFGAQVM